MSTDVPLDTRIAVTIADGAQLIGMGRSTLYQLIGDGVIPARKIGRRTVVLVVDLERFVSSQPPYERSAS
jgi:excisionase family DNA binding protein